MLEVTNECKLKFTEIMECRSNKPY